MSAPDCRFLLTDVPATPGEEDCRVADVLDISEHMTPDGELAWDVPAGTWTILRFGYTPSSGPRLDFERRLAGPRDRLHGCRHPAAVLGRRRGPPAAGHRPAGRQEPQDTCTPIAGSAAGPTGPESFPQRIRAATKVQPPPLSAGDRGQDRREPGRQQSFPGGFPQDPRRLHRGEPLRHVRRAWPVGTTWASTRSPAARTQALSTGSSASGKAISS